MTSQGVNRAKASCHCNGLCRHGRTCSHPDTATRVGSLSLLPKGVFDHFNKRAFPILNPIVDIITSILDEERQKGGANVTGNDKKEMEDALWEIVDVNDHSDSDSDSDDDNDTGSGRSNKKRGGSGPSFAGKQARRQEKLRQKMQEKEELTEALMLDRCVGAIIKAYGPSNFFTVVPLGKVNIEGSKQVNESLQLLDKRLWTLPLLKKHMMECTNSSDVKLKVFKEYIFSTGPPV